MSDKQALDQLSRELQTLYTSCVTDLANFKQQQWKITNYAMLAFGAIVSIEKTTDSINIFERSFLVALSFVVPTVAITIICQLTAAIKVRRDRLSEVRKKFTKSP